MYYNRLKDNFARACILIFTALSVSMLMRYLNLSSNASPAAYTSLQRQIGFKTVSEVSFPLQNQKVKVNNFL